MSNSTQPDRSNLYLFGGIVVVVAALFYLTQGGGSAAPAADPSAQHVQAESAALRDSFSVEESGEVGYMTYSDEKFSLSLDYPVTWSVQAVEDPYVVALFFAPAESAQDSFFDNVVLTYEDLSAHDEITLETYEAAALGQFQSVMPGYQVLESGERTLGNYEARFLRGAQSLEGVTLEILSVFLIENKQAYVMTYSYDPLNQNVFEQDVERMLESFELF